MNRLCRASLVLLLLLASAAFAGEQLTVEALLKNAKAHDGKTVAVIGTVTEYNEKTSKRGNPYVTFKLKGTKEVAAVYLQGRLKKACKNGDTVIVEGKFVREKKVGEAVYKNEIDATPAKGAADRVKIVPKSKPGKE
ncbi:MAG TPA: cytochrome c maturation protein CcmE [Fimbriimonadaceae bacterium]|nr:cytochrome c maturation protein CcmE [Fimbriimonadaceae bacterium]HRJ97311.1 cytochrome c maturation protein CcmE [Fimbriimonadaceae bacterium]